MIKGIGIDIVEIKRIEQMENREPFIKRILSDQEQALYHSYKHPNRQLQFLCGRFAAKEAYSKALGTGIGPIAFTDIEIINDDKGKPVILNTSEKVFVSISHSDEYAVAQVIIEI